MSDRARSSVRTEARDGSGTSDGVPDGAGPVDGAPDRAGAGTSAAPSGAAPAGATAIDATQALTRKAPEATAPEASAAEAKDSEAKPEVPAAVPAPPAAHPVTPLGPQTGTTRALGDGARPLGTPPAPPAGGGNRASAGRTGPAAAPLPIDATQAVTLPPAGARPVDPASRPSAARNAEATGRTGKVRGASRGPRRARLQLRHIDTWSALKISLVLSIALFFVWMVAVGVLYGVLSGLGVFDTLNDLIGQLSTTSGQDASGGDVISAGVVFGGAAVIGAVNIVLLTALCTVTAFVYNLCSDLVGGLEVTLAERE